jgi:plasmid stabilization system protein ParE
MSDRRFLFPAEEEMHEAARFYEDRSPGLGRDFLDEVERTIDSIVKDPYSGRRISGHIRRRILRRFPFGVLYAMEPSRIVIVAVMHLRREPGYWQDRIATDV